MSESDPNFPQGLNITASSVQLPHVDGDLAAFTSSAQEEAIATYGIAGRVWEASYLLAQYLLSPSGSAFDPPCSLARHTRSPGRQLAVLELGSGSGFVAHQLSRVLRLSNSYMSPDMGYDKLVATDLPNVCELLAENVAGSGIQVAGLPWGDEHAVASVIADEHLDDDMGVRLTHILCCDLVYFPHLLAPLLRTLLALTARFPDAQLLFAYKMRSMTKEQPFWAAVGMWFELERVQTPDGRGDDLFLFISRRKPATREWAVPRADAELLNGVGLPSRAGADVFDCMLMMDIGC